MLTKDLQNLITQLEAESSLFEADQLRKRIDALDELDAHFGGADSKGFSGDPDVAVIHRRAKEIRTRLEAANAAIYQSIRLEVRRGDRPRMLLQWIQALAFCDEAGRPFPGLGYDYLDELVSGVLQLREPGKAEIHPGPDMVFYQPTPVRHILQMIGALSAGDVLVDLGSGLGHVPLLVSMLTPVRSVGIEVEAAYVACARECAASLGLSGVRFVQDDARRADLSGGSVFYLYTPFTGTMLTEVLERLRKEGAGRPIKVCTLGPCTSQVAEQLWLEADAPPDTERVTLFRSR